MSNTTCARTKQEKTQMGTHIYKSVSILVTVSA